MTDPIEQRVAAVERRLDAEAPEPTNVEVDLEQLQEQIAELEAAVEAIEAYVGHVERTDDELERRANAALAAIDDLEARVERLEAGREATPDRLRNKRKSGRVPAREQTTTTIGTEPSARPHPERIEADGGNTTPNGCDRGWHGPTTSDCDARNRQAVATDSCDVEDASRTDTTDGWADDVDEVGLVQRLRARL